MIKRSTKARGPAKPTDTDCTLASHQTLARTTQFKVCPECGEQLGPHRQFPVEPDIVTQALTSMASEDEQFVATLTGQVREFIKGMAGFFLESQATGEPRGRRDHRVAHPHGARAARRRDEASRARHLAVQQAP
jgi:hypothetical protein